MKRVGLLLVAVAAWAACSPGSVLELVAPTPLVEVGAIVQGQSRRPDGTTITLDSASLRLNGRRWMPVTGEFHYARYPEGEWRDELLKMQAGGVDTVATYVFWIHHEESEGRYDWSGRRNLRRFAQLCGELGLKLMVRCGPWDHGEVRNGGFPDWLLRKGWRLRSDDARYLEAAGKFYGEIARQLAGLLWKDGGPVIAVQLENEYSGPAEHLLSLKRLAVKAGLDVPLYTRTGWPWLSTPLAFGEILPLYGVYAEGFWDRSLAPMPGSYWQGFHFSRLRTDAAIASDSLGLREARDPPDVEKYPFLTCEIGAGMMASYHRRILSYPQDAEAIALVKLGSGGASLGYYMYHGGENPEGILSTLNESQATGYWNDLPVKSYDFQTALGQYGQLRPQYHLLRRLHLLLREWGGELAEMPPAMPVRRPRGRGDTETLRWCARSDGTGGFVFVNNYERLLKLPAKTNIQFKVDLIRGSVCFPDVPVTIPENSCCIWPFNFDLGGNVNLLWATAQPLTAVEKDGVRTVFFAKTRGVAAEFCFEGAMGVKSFERCVFRTTAERTVVAAVEPGLDAALKWEAPGGEVRIVVLDEEQSLAAWKTRWQGAERIVLTRAGMRCDGRRLWLASDAPEDLIIAVYPAPESVVWKGREYRGSQAGLFQRYRFHVAPTAEVRADLELVRGAGPPRAVPLGRIADAVAAQPEEQDFKQAAVWRVRLPKEASFNPEAILRLRYVGDVARVRLNGRLLTDDFYNGRPLEVGLWRHAPEIFAGELRVEVLPLRKDAPILLSREAAPDFGGRDSVVSLTQAELVPRYEIQMEIR
jgi:hypothetical protein